MPDPNYLVRTAGDEPMTLAQTLRQKIHEIEPGRSVFDITPLSDHLDDAFAENRMRTVLLAFFAATAITLACVGLYGTLSYSLTLRRREVGLRLALGAARSEILKRVLLEGAGVQRLWAASPDACLHWRSHARWQESSTASRPRSSHARNGDWRGNAGGHR